MENFDLKKFLTENKLTSNSRALNEGDTYEESTRTQPYGTDNSEALKAMAEELLQVYKRFKVPVKYTIDGSSTEVGNEFLPNHETGEGESQADLKVDRKTNLEAEIPTAMHQSKRKELRKGLRAKLLYFPADFHYKITDTLAIVTFGRVTMGKDRDIKQSDQLAKKSPK